MQCWMFWGRWAALPSGDAWGISTFVYNPEQYFNFRSNSAISAYAGEVAELLPNCESLLDWKGPEHLDQQRRRVVGFLAAHTP